MRDLTQIDDWFLSRLDKIAALGKDTDFWASLKPQVASLDGGAKEALLRAKQLGFTDVQIAEYLGVSDDDVRAARKACGVIPRVKQIDTLAAEYAAETNYLYTTCRAARTSDLGRTRTDFAQSCSSSTRVEA